MRCRVESRWDGLLRHVRDLPVISRALTRSSMVPKPEPATVDSRGSAVAVDTVVALRVLDWRDALYESRTLPHLWPVRFADSSPGGPLISHALLLPESRRLVGPGDL